MPIRPSGPCTLFLGTAALAGFKAFSLGELVVSNEAVGDAERAEVERALGEKWGVVVA